MHSLEVRTLAYELYLGGRGPIEIFQELSRRKVPDPPSAKTIEKWAYEKDAEGKTWATKRQEALAQAQGAATQDFVASKTRMVRGILILQEKLQARAIQAVESSDLGNTSQEVYACINATKAAARIIESDLAEEVRTKDAVDLFIEAIRRVVPDFQGRYEEAVRVQFKKLSAERGVRSAE